MGCFQSTISGGPQVLWTSGVNGSNLINHAISAPLEAAKIVTARGTFEIFGRTGSLNLKLIGRYSDDLVTWGNWFQPNSGPTFGSVSPYFMTGWCDFTALQGGGNPTIKRYLQIGIEASDASATIQMCSMSYRIDLRGP